WERYRIQPKAVEALNSSYFSLMGHPALQTHAGHPRREGSQEGEEPASEITPPPEACQTCRYSYYVYDLVENLERQLEDSRQYQAQLRHMSSSILTAQEEERKRIARELHDDTAQALTSMLVRLRLLDRAVADDEAKDKVEELRDLAASTLEGVRRMALDLRPSALDDLGLVPALKWYTENLAQSLSIEVRFLANGLERRLPPELELVLYGVAQEALTNVAKHARASRVTVELERDGLWVRLAVEDDGIGFNVEEAMTSKERGLGLFGMQERLALVGGKFHMESQPRKGTKLVAEVPLRHPPPTIGG
ncbi:MAG: sensor histidine kinase, partial [Chloroflexi bacterium]|nr:sensor histidine kinase [Chloroflexota bacterium]